MSGRRAWMRNALRAGGLGLAMALGVGSWLGRDRLARWRLARALREQLAPVEVDDAVLAAFFADVERHDPSLLDEAPALELLAGRLLLSTDFFSRGATETGALAYRRYANVYVNACVNPFARLVDDAASAEAEGSVDALFAARCVSCHDGGGAPSLEGVGERLGDELSTVLREGRGAMPPARALGLDESSIERLVGWLRSR